MGLLKRIRQTYLPLVLIFTLMLTLACGTTPACTPKQYAPPPHDARNMPYKSFVILISSTLYVDCEENEELKISTCEMRRQSTQASGVIIHRSTTKENTSYILTADHMCDRRNYEPDGLKIYQDFRAFDYWNDKHSATWVASATAGVDACVLEIDGTSDRHVVAQVAESDPKQGERVYNLSAPSGIFSKRMVLTFEGFFSGFMEHYAVYTIPGVAGSSGSAVLNRMGQIVSTLWSTPREEKKYPGGTQPEQIMENVTFGTTTEQLRKLVDRIKKMDAAIVTTSSKTSGLPASGLSSSPSSETSSTS